MQVDVALLLYSRPHHTQAVLDSLVANGVGRVRAFMDTPADQAAAAGQLAVARHLEQRSDLQVELHRAPRRLGVAGSVRAAVDRTLATADAVIVLEDDCVVRPDGVKFFLDALERYHREPAVRSVCGYRYPCTLEGDPAAPIFLSRFCPWGWATWRDRWQDHDPDLGRLIDRTTATSIPADLARLCRSPAYLDGRADIWSVAWAALHYLTDTCAVYPPWSMIENIGFDGSGRHSPRSEAFRTPWPDHRPAIAWDGVRRIPENEVLVERFLAGHHAAIYPDP